MIARTSLLLLIIHAAHASELAQKIKELPCKEALQLAQQIDDEKGDEVRAELLRSQLLPVAQQRALLSRLTQSLDTKKKITACALSPAHDYLMLAFNVDNKGLCEKWSLPILRKKAVMNSDAPLQEITIHDVWQTPHAAPTEFVEEGSFEPSLYRQPSYSVTTAQKVNRKEFLKRLAGHADNPAKNSLIHDLVMQQSGIACVLNNDGSYGIWDLTTWPTMRLLKKAVVSKSFRPLCLNPSGVRALFGAPQGLALYDCIEEVVERKIDLEGEAVQAAFDPDRNHVFVVIAPSTVCYLNSSTGEKLLTLVPKIPHEVPLEKIVISDDGAVALFYDSKGLVTFAYGSNKNHMLYFRQLTIAQTALMRVIALFFEKPDALRELLGQPECKIVLNSLDRTIVAALFPQELMHVKNGDGWLPIHEVVIDNDEDELQKVLEQTNDIDARGADGMTALMCAAHRGNCPLMKILLTHGASLSLKSDNGMSIAQWAAVSNYPAAVELLVKNGLLLTEQTEMELMITAAKFNATKIITWLLDGGRAIDSRDELGRTALHHAASSKSHAALVLLMSRKAHYDAQDLQGNTPLHLAVLTGDQDLCDNLIGMGVAIGIQNNNGELPFDSAFRSSHAGLIKSLVSAQMRLLGCAGEGDLIHFAASNGFADLVAYLLQCGHYESQLDKEKNTPLHLACAKDKRAVVELLLTALEKNYATIQKQTMPAQFLPINFRNNVGVSALHLVTKMDVGAASFIERMLKLGAVVDSRTDKDETPLHFACFYGNYDAAVRLLASGANCCAVTTQKKSPLHLAIEGGRHSLITLLLEKRAPVNGFAGCVHTPLHNAAFIGDVKAVQLLLEVGANVTSLAFEKTPACLAAQEGHVELCEFLLSEISKVSEAPKGWTLLHVAADYGLFECVSLLVEDGWDADVVTETSSGDTPLHLAADAGHADCIEALIGGGATINKKDASGKAALHRAIIQEQLDCARVLLRNGALLLEKDDTEKMALDYAVHSNFVEGIQLLLKAEVEQVPPADGEFADWDIIQCANYLGYDDLSAYLQNQTEQPAEDR